MNIPAADLDVGLDVAVRVDPASYEISEDARGRAFAFSMDATAREQIADIAGTELGRVARSVETLDVEPGYIRARIHSPDHRRATPGKILSAFRDAARRYNETHADYADTRLLLHRDTFACTLRPDEPRTRAGFVAGLPATDAAPEADAPVWTYERDGAGETVLDADSRLAVRAFLPFDCRAMYDPDTAAGMNASLAVEWDHPEVRDHLRETVEDPVPWPASPRESIPRVAIYPTHAEVDVYQNAANPAAVAGRARDALRRYNNHRPADEARSPKGGTYTHPPIKFRGTPLVVGLEHGRTADDWIREKNLDAVDGEPIEPEPDEPADTEVDEGGTLRDALSPFGSGGA